MIFSEIVSNVSYDWKQILPKIWIYSIDEFQWFKSNGSKWKPKLQYPSCTSFNLNDFFPSNLLPTITKLMLRFRKSDKILRFYVEDKKHALRKPTKKLKVWRFLQ